MKAIVLAVALFAGGPGCVETQVSVCADGRICPSGLLCDLTHQQCVTPEQLSSCIDAADGEPCTIFVTDDGVCRDHVCLEPECGDGFVATGEDCEPGDDIVLSCTAEEYGYYRGDVRCGSDCLWDESECSGRCQDTVLDSSDGEECDGEAPDETCLDFGFDVGSTGCNELCFTDRSGCSFLGWRPISIATEQTIHDVWTATDGTAIAVGDKSAFHWDGEQWTERVLTDGALALVWGWSADSAVAASNSGLFVYDGVAWTEDLSSPQSLAALWGSSLDDIYVSASGGPVYHYDGSAWSPVTEITEVTNWAIHGTGADDVWLGTTAGTPKLYHFDGNDWTSYAVPELSHLLDLWVAPAGQLLVVGETDDDVSHLLTRVGSSFQAAGSFAGGRLVSVTGSSADDIVGVGQNGTMVHWDGQRLRVAPNQTARNFEAVAGFGPGRYVAVGGQGGAFAYSGAQHAQALASPAAMSDGTAMAVAVRSDGPAFIAGTLREPVFLPSVRLTVVDPSPGTVTYYTGGTAGTGIDIVASGANEAWIVDDSGRIFAFNPPKEFTEVLATTEVLNGIWLDAGGLLVAVGSNGLITTSPTGNLKDWTISYLDSAHDLQAVWGRNPSDVYAVGSAGGVFHFDGDAWSQLTTPIAVDLFDIDGDSAGLVVGGGGGQVWYFDGVSWVQVPATTDLDISAVAMTTAADLWAGSSDGVLMSGTTSGLSPVRLDSFRRVEDIDATPRAIYLAMGDKVRVIDRTRWWSCTADEVHCDDGGDDDCDGLPDELDPSCTP